MMKEWTFKLGALFVWCSVVVAGTYSVDVDAETEERLKRIFFSFYQGTEYPGNSTHATLDNSCDLCQYLDVKRSTVIFIHGWLDSEFAASTEAIVSATMSLRTVNVIIVDWSHIATHSYTFYASRMVPTVAHRIAVSIDRLIECCLDSTTLRLIGHSLGAQISGYIGRIMNNTLQRITGLDPASPFFGPTQPHLTATDAVCVDIIHSCAGLLGTRQYVNGVELYPNGGGPPQPGCPISKETNTIAEAATCSHWRSFYYWAHSTMNSSSMFAVKCDSWKKFKKNRCANNPVIRVGYETPCNITGKFYFTTNPTSPYGRGMAGIEYKPSLWNII